MPLSVIDQALAKMRADRAMLKSAFQPPAGAAPAGPPPGAAPAGPPPGPGGDPSQQMPPGGAGGPPPPDPSQGGAAMPGANPAEQEQIDPQQFLQVMEMVQQLSQAVQQMAQHFQQQQQAIDKANAQMMDIAQKDMATGQRLDAMESAINQPQPFDPGMQQQAQPGPAAGRLVPQQ